MASTEHRWCRQLFSPSVGPHLDESRCPVLSGSSAVSGAVGHTRGGLSPPPHAAVPLQEEPCREPLSSRQGSCLGPFRLPAQPPGSASRLCLGAPSFQSQLQAGAAGTGLRARHSPSRRPALDPGSRHTCRVAPGHSAWRPGQVSRGSASQAGRGLCGALPCAQGRGGSPALADGVRAWCSGSPATGVSAGRGLVTCHSPLDVAPGESRLLD